jgi:hypothetical protein
VQRIHEILTEEYKLTIGYSTLTRLIKRKGIGKTEPDRSCHIADIPGEEMQHDTTLYQIVIGSSKHKIICSGLYLRYSKMRYIKFYRRFNTNLAIYYGSGANAVINPEMVAFENNYGFKWKAHAIGHANRKAGTERNFWTVETNFLPGRTFTSLEDLNAQGFEWATERYAKRPQAKTKLIPVELFETEKPFLVTLPQYVCAPYLQHNRLIDEYGYISFDGNFYWIPDSVSVKAVTVLQYTNEIRIMNGTTEITRYTIAPDGSSNVTIEPQGCKKAPRYAPKNRKLGCVQEENVLKDLDDSVKQYLSMIYSKESGVKQCPAFVRKLYLLYRQWGADLFTKTIKRALAYNVNETAVLENIARLLIEEDLAHTIIDTDINNGEYINRKAFQDGRFSDESWFNDPNNTINEDEQNGTCN